MQLLEDLYTARSSLIKFLLVNLCMSSVFIHVDHYLHGDSSLIEGGRTH